MHPLPPETLPTVPELNFWIFNLAIPNLIAASVLIGVFAAAVWGRLEHSVFEPVEEDERS
jgi:hypothetical protein